MNEAEQRGYEVGIAETEEVLRAEVLAVCRIYCAKTWDEALNWAGVEASSKLRMPENVFYPEAIRPSDTPTPQAETIPSTVNPNEAVLLPNIPPPDQSDLTKEDTVCPEASSDKTEVASPGFQQDLASTILSANGATKDKGEVTTAEVDKSASQAPKIQIKLKK